MKDGLGGVAGEDHLGFSVGGSGGGPRSGGYFGKKFNIGLRTQIRAGIGGGVEDEGYTDRFGAERSGEFESDSRVGGGRVWGKDGLLG